uniref:Uncharacterized protein n=1 Tax=Haptolina ericina TaxID=156174 RepID=A0A7S3AD25_9EUKA
MTIHWASSLWMAPLQIRYKRESHEGRELWRKRVCVQFAQSTGAELSGGIKTTVGKFSKENLEATEGGVPIELLSDAKETFDGAMVIYKPGLNGTRSQASIESRTWRPEHEQRVYRKGVAPTPRGGEASDAASKWLDKMIDDTNDRVQELLGDVRDVQTALVKGASEGMPLKEIPFQVKDDHHGRFVPTEDDQYNMRQKMPPDIPMRMLEGICSADAKLVEKIYADLASIFKDPVVKKALGSIMAERVRSDLDRPASFFQVAIDLPGFGATEDLLGKDELMSANFLKEVITSLSKEHAFAIVVETHAADALFQVLFEAPKITSFIAVRQPILEETEPERLTRIIHPVFVPWDPRTASAYVQTARKLNEFLPDGASLKVSLAKVPSFYNVELGTELVSFFAKHNWHGMMNSDGTSRKLPLLTRLDGGLSMWTTGQKGEAAVAAATEEAALAEAKKLEAAKRIEAGARGKLQRQKTRDIRRNSRVESSEGGAPAAEGEQAVVLDDDNAKQLAAAIKIEAIERGKLQRQKTRDMRQKLQSRSNNFLGSLEQAEARDAARGVIVDEAPAQPSDTAATADPAGSIVADPTAEAAAKVQALQRGKMQRQATDQLKAEEKAPAQVTPAQAPVAGAKDAAADAGDGRIGDDQAAAAEVAPRSPSPAGDKGGRGAGEGKATALPSVPAPTKKPPKGGTSARTKPKGDASARAGSPNRKAAKATRPPAQGAGGRPRAPR